MTISGALLELNIPVRTGILPVRDLEMITRLVVVCKPDRWTTPLR